MISHDNKYINMIIQYTKQYTPVEIQINIAKYHEVCHHLNSKHISDHYKEIIAAIYTLFYTALDCHKMAKYDSSDLQYYILLGDYISSYCTEILYKNKKFELLDVFTQNTKKVIFNRLNQKHTDHLLKALMNTI
ncbi:hypothetical protein [Haloplasma contractile]|uniref:Uncharacterized protein n=1 Tax=Haloplasma contractile SSD-17B TaxID=1033810 RepID=F7PWN7_9MOLU|nr:hypothetical protein [Haloplasma contractile]ERJ12591.1 hypothetical protein HLPCO_001577 [Haloplasma contractile SSD-17B]